MTEHINEDVKVTVNLKTGMMETNNPEFEAWLSKYYTFNHWWGFRRKSEYNNTKIPSPPILNPPFTLDYNNNLCTSQMRPNTEIPKSINDPTKQFPKKIEVKSGRCKLSSLIKRICELFRK